MRTLPAKSSARSGNDQNYPIIQMRESDRLSVLLEKGLVMTRQLVKSILALGLVLLGLVASGAALAQHHDHGYGYGGNVRFGISLGFPIYAPDYYPAPYYGY